MAELACLVLAPAYDDATRITSCWARRTAEKMPAGSALIGKQATLASLGYALGRFEASSREYVVAFFGHGLDSRVLTESGLGVRWDDVHDHLCNEEEFPPESRAYFIAYCCSSARTFGRRFQRRSGRKCFLGFSGVIPLFLFDTQCEVAFKKPIETAILLVVRNEATIEEARAALERAYCEQLWRWSNTMDFGGHRWARMVRICLRIHIRMIA